MAASLQVATMRAVFGHPVGGRLDVAKMRAVTGNVNGGHLEVAKMRALFGSATLDVTLGSNLTLDPFDVRELTAYSLSLHQAIQDADTYSFQQISSPGGSVMTVPTVTLNSTVPWASTYKAPAKFTQSILYFRVTVTTNGTTNIAEVTDTIRPHAGVFVGIVGTETHAYITPPPFEDSLAVLLDGGDSSSLGLTGIDGGISSSSGTGLIDGGTA